ncbi:MAG: sigma-54-dependent Fis family transcriptional regulator [Piscinibacter sp.]
MTDPESRQHVARVLSTLEQSPASPASAEDWLAASWARSVQHHRLDPGGSSYRRVLSAPELREAADRMGVLLDLARPHVDELDRHVAPANYCILLTDASGLTLDLRTHGDVDARFKRAGVRPGICWSESSEGTCGIGTAIENRAAVLVHKTEHFRADNIPLSCSAAPVFGLDDEVLAVLDASTLFSPYQRESQVLVFNLVKEKALLIENAYAEYRLRDHWRLSFGPGPAAGARGAASEMLIAFDDHGRILAANRPARRLLERLVPQGGATLAELFESSPEDLISQAHAAPGVALPLRVAGTGELMHGVLRAPRGSSDSAAATAPRRVAAAPRRGFAQLATGDAALQQLVGRAVRVVNRDMPIMLLGETGTGKEAFAQALHTASQRAARPFVALNCAAIPETLIESELFGYRDGAFTGARARGARGKVLQADGGTLFLDEIGDMPLTLQSRLLRVLAEGEVMPLGAEEPVPVRLNVICATHQDLQTLVAEGRFREDLYYRLAGACFRLPPLRERTDRAELIRLVLREEAQALGRHAEIGAEAMERLMAHPWPGNIRQLRLALRYALAVADGERLQVHDFADELWGGVPPPVPPAALLLDLAPAPPLPPALAAERERIVQTLRQQRWQATAAARALGMTRSTFYRRLKALAIVAPHKLPPQGIKRGDSFSLRGADLGVSLPFRP